jgi:hypothetical protein
LAAYGWRRDRGDALNNVEPIYQSRRKLPFAYRLRHPSKGRPLVVVGHYEVTSGGCDTIRARDGGLAEAVAFAGEFASRGHDVMIEGLRLSSEVALSAKLAAAHPLHILLLSTPVARCVQNLVARRRASKSSVPRIERNTAEEHRRVEEACERLRPHATVEVLNFDRALVRAQELLGLEGPGICRKCRPG